MKRWVLIGMLALSLCWVYACDSAGDSAKKRVTEKQDIVEKVQHREVTLTQIDLSKVPQDTDELLKILLMTQEEVAERMGDYTLQTTGIFETAQGERKFKLSESETLIQRKNGDFHLMVSNDKSNQVDMFWIGGKLINKVGGGDRHESNSVGKHLFWREKTYSTFDRMLKMFHGHLRFEKQGTERIEGREAMKIKISLNPKGTTPETGLPNQYKLPGQYQISLKGTHKLIEKQRKRVGKFIQADGTVWIDTRKAVVLKFKLETRYSIPLTQKLKDKLIAKGQTPGPDVEFLLRGTYEMKDIGKAKAMKPPAAEPPMERRQPNLNPLDFAPKGVKKTDEASVEPAKKGTPTPEPATEGAAPAPAAPDAPTQAPTAP